MEFRRPGDAVRGRKSGSQRLSVHQEQFAQKDRQAGAEGDGEEIAADEGDDNTDDQRKESGPGGIRGGDDGREGHDCQSDVGHIVQERAQERIGDVATEQDERQRPDYIYGCGHDQQ